MSACEKRLAAESSTAFEPIHFIEKEGIRYKGYLLAKRLFDIFSAAILLLLLSPVLLICLLIKWLEDFHNPLYVSTRMGLNGVCFPMLKIRSMAVNSDSQKERLIEQGLNEADGPVFKMKNDPRITPFGRFLRRTSLDELPQLLSIIKGDMSVVGPRPPIPAEVEKYTPEQRMRLSVKGGLLCLWQIQPDRHSISFEDWVRYDLEYIRNQSFTLDMEIICKGAFMVLSGRSGD